MISREEIELCYRNYYNDVFRFCLSRLNEVDAKDVTQDTFLLLQERKNSLKYSSSIKFWLMDVAGKKIHEQYRTQAKNYYEELSEYDLTVESIEALLTENQVTDEEIEKKKQIILSKLNEEEFALYIKAVNEHKSYKQICEELNLSRDAVSSRLKRLKKKLKVAAKLATTPVGLLILRLFFW